MEDNKKAYNTDETPSELLRLKPTETRGATDKFFILLFPLYLLLWLGIGIYELLTDDRADSETRDLAYHFYLISKRFFQNFSILTVFIIILFLYICSKLRDNLVVFVVQSYIITISLTFVVVIFWQIELNIGSDPICLLFILIIITTVLVYHATIFICTKEIGSDALGPMIKEPLRAVINSLVPSLFSLIIICLLALIFIFTVIIILPMTSSKEYPEFFICLRVASFAAGGAYIFNFIWNFGFIIMSDYFMYYCGVTEDQKVSKTYIIQSISRVMRYHIGTVAFLSIPIFPSMCAFVMAYKNNHQSDKKTGYKLIHFISKISLITDISTYSLIQTSIYGCESLKSIKEIIYLHRNNSLLFLTLNAIPLKIVEISAAIAIVIGAVVQLLFGYMDFDHLNRTEYYLFTRDNFVYKVIIEIGLTIVYAYFMTAFLVRPAACTFSVCKMTRRRGSTILENQPALPE